MAAGAVRLTIRAASTYLPMPLSHSSRAASRKRKPSPERELVGGRYGILRLCVPDPCLQRRPVIEVDAFADAIERLAVVWIAPALPDQHQVPDPQRDDLAVTGGRQWHRHTFGRQGAIGHL
jgi:hypothetical protein